MKIYQKQAILQEVAVYTTYLFEKLGFVVFQVFPANLYIKEFLWITKLLTTNKMTLTIL